ncbi:type IV pilus modification PilV family protein [Paractinoplanes lichenicola]|uniref:Type II secretion system protein n=1 Tax=Paractinoplanes lichenicola TaxID=2802976 RepID=A0ABS1VF17_9ACTN|nr:type II secretion system protein [Actinoplanes lichenicola]MBL7253269.1 type II secretion system protein [Actinoplanes lichenicola]
MESSTRRRADEGFTLVELTVALAIITVVMTSLTVFLVHSRDAGRYATQRDTAVRLALDGMEKARGMRGSALLGGRQQCLTPCADVVSAQAGTLLGTNTTRWDAAGPGTLAVPQPGAQSDGSVVAAPGDPEILQLDGLPFKRFYYLGACWQPPVGSVTTGIACGPATTTAPLVRLVVAVTWRDSQCPANTCSHAEAALFSTAIVDPFLVG